MKEDYNSKRLVGSKVLITGANSGLGFSISIALAKEGAEVIAIGKDKARLEDVSDAIEQAKGSVTLVCIDLAKQGTIEELSNRISENYGELHVIIHCAMSSLQMMPINQVSLKEVEINLLSPIMISFRLISSVSNLRTTSDLHLAKPNLKAKPNPICFLERKVIIGSLLLYSFIMEDTSSLIKPSITITTFLGLIV